MIMPKILIVEDDLPLLRMYQVVLQKAGCQVLSALDGEEGIEKVRDDNPDLILLDVVLPKKNGFQVLEYLKSDVNFSRIPVVCLSVLHQEEDIEQCKRLGAKDFLVKTDVDPEDVISKVLSYIKPH